MHANAQEKATKKHMYKAWVKKTDRSSRLIGALYEVQDTKLLISNSFKAESSQFNYIDVYAYEIEKIKVRRKGQVALGALIGLAVGFTTFIGLADGDDPPCTPPPTFVSSATVFAGYGGISRFIDSGGLDGYGGGADVVRNIYMQKQNYLYDLCETSRQTNGEKALQYGFTGGLAAGIVGALLGSLKIKIPINGSESKYRANLPRLKKYAYQK